MGRFFKIIILTVSHEFQGAMTVTCNAFKGFTTLNIPRNSLKLRPLVNSNPTTHPSFFHQYVYFAGKRIARITPQAESNGSGITHYSTHYYFEDQIGSSRVITDSSGNVCYDADFYPFGSEKTYTYSCDSHFKFTGKGRDPETGLDEFGARYYSSAMGRFITPDWAAKAVAVPYCQRAFRFDPVALT